MTSSWYEDRPELAEEIRAELRARFPNLHLFIDGAGKAEIRGTYPVCSS